jgi:hypothetical protein
MLRVLRYHVQELRHRSSQREDDHDTKESQNPHDHASSLPAEIALRYVAERRVLRSESAERSKLRVLRYHVQGLRHQS